MNTAKSGDGGSDERVGVLQGSFTRGRQGRKGC